MRIQQLQRRIAHDTALVGVLGQGYVGLSLAASAAVEGLTVAGIDVDAHRIAQLAAGRNVVAGVDDGLFAAGVDTTRMTFGTDPEVLTRCDVVVICVPTPVVEHRPDLRFIEAAGRMVASHLRRDSLVILESTTYPGTTEQVLRPLLEESGLRAGRDFLLAYSPERIDPGNAKYGLRNTPRVVGGIDAASSETARLFYAKVVDDVTVLSSCRSAEMAKLLENTFRMVNIALVNEIALMCDRLGLDVWEVVKAAATKPFGFMPFYPGPGLGGHCIPIDPFYLSWKAKQTGFDPRFIELAGQINGAMPHFVVDKIADALNRHQKSINGSTVLVLGVAYKRDIDDMRESPSLDVMALLKEKGAKVRYVDPYVPKVSARAWHGGVDIETEALTPDTIAAADCVAILTEHKIVDYAMVLQSARLIVDTRNAIAGQHPHVIKLGAPAPVLTPAPEKTEEAAA
jgi:UDP-N-acetyl-D-glucosamine dehydrogenase